MKAFVIYNKTKEEEDEEEEEEEIKKKKKEKIVIFFSEIQRFCLNLSKLFVRIVKLGGDLS